MEEKECNNKTALCEGRNCKHCCQNDGDGTGGGCGCSGGNASGSWIKLNFKKGKTYAFSENELAALIKILDGLEKRNVSLANIRYLQVVQEHIPKISKLMLRDDMPKSNVVVNRKRIPLAANPGFKIERKLVKTRRTKRNTPRYDEKKGRG